MTDKQEAELYNDRSVYGRIEVTRREGDTFSVFVGNSFGTQGRTHSASNDEELRLVVAAALELIQEKAPLGSADLPNFTPGHVTIEVNGSKRLVTSATAWWFDNNTRC